ncbi:hypothetical protein BC830DRAFT_303916 [Chytriomyces sp. MP71]|nr:hypothetical protein BC830DRAFT_303916 [Chytriomyces sp. MP71]
MSECVPVAPDSTCSPWSTGFFINTSAMSDRYQLTVNTSDTWEKARLNHIRDQRNLILTCGNVDSGLMLQNFNWIVQFHSTKLCLEDIFILSGGCNAFAQRKKSVVSVPCNHVVTSYRRSISTMVDSSGCANTASSETGNYEIAMDMLHSTNEITEFISEWLELVGEGSCIGGVDSDVTSCGKFAS